MPGKRNENRHTTFLDSAQALLKISAVFFFFRGLKKQLIKKHYIKISDVSKTGYW